MSSPDFSYIDGSRDVLLTESFPEIRNSIKAVVFDLDGTLTDSISQIIACTKHTFEEYGFAIPDDHAIMSTIGLELQEGLTFLLPENKKDLGQQITADYRKIFLAHSEYKIDKIFDGVEELVKKLKELGIKIGYASGRSLAGVHRTLDNTFLGDYCDAICAGNEVPSKPDPAMMNTVCKRLGIENKSALGVGDSGLDIKMYQNAGSMSAAVQTGTWSGDALKKLNPTLTLPNISYLTKLFAE